MAAVRLEAEVAEEPREVGEEFRREVAVGGVEGG